MYIIASSTISHQPTFRNKGFSSQLSDLSIPSAIVHPDYNTFIPIMQRRRMSDVLKMAIACAADCLEQSGVTEPDAIIVGTSMGCNTFTKNFLDKIISADGGLMSPTSFIHSTHNTIAGQISLLIENHNYNMTHTQNSLSFEQALLDGMLCVKEGCRHVLVGAADEMENALYNMNARLNSSDLHSTCGASFFILAVEEPDTESIIMADVASFGLMDDLPGLINEFLKSNNVSAEEVDLLLYSCFDKGRVEILSEIFYHSKITDYQKISGIYFTNSAFALHYGIDALNLGNTPLSGERIKRVLICNNVIPENLGLILIGSQ